jgi:glycosyltransferase involved in cell wall biosynthesis
LVREVAQVEVVKTKQAYRFAEQSGYRKIQYTPVGVDTKFFTPGNGAEFRKKMGLREDAFLVLYVGKIVSYRNPDIFLRLLNWSKAEQRNIDVAMIGEGPDAPAIKKEAHRLGIGDRMHIIGRLPNAEVREAMRACDAFVLPMKQGTLFNFGMVLLEAMSCGAPTISAPVPAAVDIIDDGRNGFVMPFDDVKALSNIISRLIDDRELRARIGKEGRKTMTAFYDWDVVSQGFERAYIEAIRLHGVSES